MADDDAKAVIAHLLRIEQKIDALSAGRAPKTRTKKRARPQHRPPRIIEPDDLTRSLAKQALRRHGLS